VPTESPIAPDEPGTIIEAAYACLSAPHEGPVPVAAILEEAGVSTRAFYRHFGSKDEMFLAMFNREGEILAGRLNRIVEESEGGPREQLEAWIGTLCGVLKYPRGRTVVTVLDSDEVRAAKGYRAARQAFRVKRELSLIEILERGRRDGSFPLTDPKADAVAISAMVTREMTTQADGKRTDPDLCLERVLAFSMRALGAQG
jgi:AcrR family transcriptional regulator